MTKAPAAARIVGSRYALLLLGVAGLACAGIFYNLAAAPAVAMVAYRNVFAVVLVLPLLALSRARSAAAGRTPFRSADVGLSAAAGAVFALDLTLWAIGLHYTSVSSAMLFVSTTPVWIALFGALFFDEKPAPLALAGVAVALAGTAIVAGVDVRISGTALIGDGLAVAAAVLETWYLLIGRHVRKRIDAPRYASVVYASCAVVSCAVLAVSRTPWQMSAHDVGLALALGLVVTVIGHTLIQQSLGYMPAAVVAVAFLAQPMIAAVLALIFLGQTVPVTTMVGGLVALGGIGVVAFANERTSPGIDQTVV